MAETKEIAQQVVDAADGSTLAGDASFEQWTGEAGDDGFMSVLRRQGRHQVPRRRSARHGR